MKNQWTETKETFLGRPCLRHSVTNELAIYGKYGEIYLNNSSTCKARVWSPKKTGIQPPEGYKWRSGDETVITFDNSELVKYIKLLKVPTLASTQASYVMEDPCD